KVESARQHFGEIEHGMRLKRADVLTAGNLKQAPHASRDDDVQIAPEAADDLRDRRRDLFDALPMLFPRRVRAGVIFSEAALAKAARLARLAILRQKIAAHALDERPERRLRFLLFERAFALAAQGRDVEGEHRVLRVADRTVAEKLRDSASYAGEHVAQ